eukprot:scaffold758_cov123-Isochrysis_galbana.AAC.5
MKSLPAFLSHHPSLSSANHVRPGPRGSAGALVHVVRVPRGGILVLAPPVRQPRLEDTGGELVHPVGRTGLRVPTWLRAHSVPKAALLFATPAHWGRIEAAHGGTGRVICVLCCNAVSAPANAPQKLLKWVICRIAVPPRASSRARHTGRGAPTGTACIGCSLGS